MAETADVDRLLAHADWLRALARRLVGPASADDVVQETFLAAMRMPPEMDRPERPWLARVLVNVTRMRFRSDARRVRREDAAAIEPAEASSPDQIVERLEMHRVLCELVVSLDESQRRTLVLHYFDGLSLAEIARADGVPDGTVRWRHKQALERLRARLDERSHGDRQAWVAALAPIATPPTKAAAAVAGGILVKKFVIAAIVVIVAALIVWKVSVRDPKPPRAAVAAVPTAHIRFGEPKQPGTAIDPRGSIHGSVRGGDAATAITLFEIAGDDVPTLVARQVGTRFDFSALGAGTYCIAATYGRASGSACDLELRAGDRLERDVTLAHRGARLHGIVSDADGGVLARPLVVVQRFPHNGAVAATRGDDQGRYELGVAPGWYRVTAQADGYTTTRQHVEIAGELQLDLRLNAGATLAGRVVDERREPAAGATVTVSTGWRSTRSIKAGADGRFAIEGLRPGHFEIMATRGELVAAPEQVRLAFGATEEVELVVAERRACIEGRVIDESGRGVSGARVDARGPVTRGVETDRHGKFRVAGLVPGTYDVAATADGFVRASREKVVGHDTTSAVTLRVARGITVTGSVRTATGHAVAGATVASSAANLRDPRLDVQTDASGAFRIGPLPPGSVRLSSFHASHGVTEIVNVELPPGSSPNADLVFRASSSIDGLVLFDDGKPAGGAVVTVTPTEAPARWTLAADRDGRFALASLPAGRYHVAAVPPIAAAPQTISDERSSTEATLAAGARTRVELRVPGGTEHIRGHVVDQAGEPVAGAAVWAEREGGMLVSAGKLDDVRTYAWRDGAFELANLPRGTYTVYASHPDHASGKLAAVAAGATGITIAVTAPAAVSGRVSARDGTPVRSFRIQWQWITRTSHNGQSMTRAARMFDSPDGRFTLDHLEPTSLFVVSVETPNGATGNAGGFALEPGQRKADLELTVKEMGTVRGRIVDRVTGEPGLGLVVFFPAVASREQVPVDGNGHFEARVPAGSYEQFHVQSQHQGYPEIERPFTVKPGEVTELGDVVVDLHR